MTEQKNLTSIHVDGDDINQKRVELDTITNGIECSCKYYPKNFSSYEEYVKFLKEKGLAFEAPKGV